MCIWFWPGDQLDLSPMPVDFLTPGKPAQAIVEELRTKTGAIITANHNAGSITIYFPD